MADMRQLRKSNEQRVVAAMLHLGQATRGDLARETAMSQSTIGRIVERLLKESILAEVGNSQAEPRTNDVGAIGRPSRHLALNSFAPRFLGIQIGVRNTRLSLLAVAPPTSDEWTIGFSTPDSAEKWFDRIIKNTAGLNLRGLKGVVVSVPGVVDEAAGRVLFSPNMRWVEDLDFASLRTLLKGLPIQIGQEIRLLARGQFLMQPKTKNFLHVDIGSGVGAAIVRDGAVIVAALPLSGELGHSPVIGNKRQCNCGSIGCVETLISRPGLLASAAEHRWPSTWPEFVKKLHSNGPPAWVCASLDALATTICAAFNIVGLDDAVITGALSEMPSSVTTYLQNQIQQGTMWRRFGTVSSRLEPRHRQAGMAAFAIDRFLLSDSA